MVFCLFCAGVLVIVCGVLVICGCFGNCVGVVIIVCGVLVIVCRCFVNCVWCFGNMWVFW
jgi:hypothetical protein